MMTTEIDETDPRKKNHENSDVKCYTFFHRLCRLISAVVCEHQSLGMRAFHEMVIYVVLKEFVYSTMHKMYI
jgi:hypothetical protein